jgi:hypothetical protein
MSKYTTLTISPHNSELLEDIKFSRRLRSKNEALRTVLDFYNRYYKKIKNANRKKRL